MRANASPTHTAAEDTATGLNCKYIDVDRAVSYVVECKNFDGGFGCVPGSESHAGQIYCCVGALAIGNRCVRIFIHGILSIFLLHVHHRCGVTRLCVERNGRGGVLYM